jgi:hypothetical protein
MGFSQSAQILTPLTAYDLQKGNESIYVVSGIVNVPYFGPNGIPRRNVQFIVT